MIPGQRDQVVLALKIAMVSAAGGQVKITAQDLIAARHKYLVERQDPDGSFVLTVVDPSKDTEV